MSFQSPFLNTINNVNEAPLEAYILYNLNGGIFWIDPKNYANFLLQWIGIGTPPPLTMDLSSAGMHSIVLDFDYKKSDSNFSLDFLTAIESVLKLTLIPTVSNFTYIIATRKGGKGVHIHLPEFKIAHDDYILFCDAFHYKFKQAIPDEESYTLDILSNAMLAGAAKPDLSPYLAAQVVYVDERVTIHIPILKQEAQQLTTIKNSFPKRKDNSNSIFRKLLLYSNKSLNFNHIKPLMMPVVVETQFPITFSTLVYPTIIGKCSNTSTNWQDLATFTFKKSTEQSFISKCVKFKFDSSNLLKTYHYLKLNSKNMEEFETNNHALKMWFQRLSFINTHSVHDSHIPEMFLDIHEMLRFEHTMLSENPNPIKTIMQFNEGYYFLPIFYALCQHYNVDSSTMAEQLSSLLDKSFYPLLERIKLIHPKIIQFAITEVSINTIHFCANNLYKEQPKNYREKLKSIVENNKRAILSMSTHDQIVDLVRSIQERHLPFRVLRLKNALKRPGRYVWNALTESWQEVIVSEISDHIHNLWNSVKQFINEYHTSGGLGGPEDELIKAFSVSTVVSAIISDTSMERKDIQMDTHKWFLRLNDGVLDLLTGHIGGVVPEFFLSDRKINIAIPRTDMLNLCNDSLKYFELYEMLINEKFFLKYMQSLFLDDTDNLFDTLRKLIDSETLDDELCQSMLYFYINLCKCMCFEYDMVMYMLDILASVLVGTNYERKFFVWKGLTRNGKSKLFELMGRVLGGYYHSIQSENLAPGHSVNNATPELASTLFSCRMVTSEELEKKLDENRVKQMTGNSFVSFRNMYEQNSGGIPTAKLFASTNNYPECKATEAFKDRVVAVPFDAEFTDNAPNETSKQISANIYKKDAYVVEQSFKGCFFMLYFHLKKFINFDDGLLHWSPNTLLNLRTII